MTNIPFSIVSELRIISLFLVTAAIFGFSPVLLQAQLAEESARFSTSSASSQSGSWNSSIIYKGADGTLVYYSDEDGNRIPDFSHAGYRGGGVPLPELPVRITLSPSSTGNDTQQIQEALDEVGEMEPDENGHRGAVLLNPGTYRITNTIRITQSGVVLRGSGDDVDPAQNTVIHAAKEIGSVSIQVGRGNVDWSTVSGSPIVEIMSEFVAVGNRHFEVSDASRFDVGDEIIIFHGATNDWIEAVEFGGLAETAPNPWRQFESNLNIVKLRTITGISGNVIAIDAPVYNHLERRLSRVLVSKPNFGQRVAESGVEHLRLVLESDGEFANNHGNNALIFNGVVDSWAYGVTVLHFRFQGIGVTNGSHVTIQNSRALEPHSPIDGALRYNFNVQARATNILFTDVHASEGRHDFVSNGTASVSGVVFHNGTSTGAYNASEGHRRWSMGLLFDNLTFRDANTSIVLGLYNRGSYGTRHGWSSAHSVSWNVDVGERRAVIQQPPTAQNYGIATTGTVNGSGPFPGRVGFIEGTGETPAIASLYEAQLYDRLTFGIPPDTPARVRVEPAAEQHALQLSWNHLSLEDITIIIERADGDGPFEELTRVSSTETSFLDETVGEDLYTYRLVAVDNGRMSAWSNEASFNMQVPSFNLRSPSNGAVLELSGNDTRNFSPWWTATTSDFPLFYTWYLTDDSGDFAKPLLTRESEINLVQISYGDLDAVLQEAGVDSGATFNGYWTVRASAGNLRKWADEPFSIQIIRGGVITSVNQPASDLPSALQLKQNFPNPFNPETVISFGLPEAGQVQLVIYDMMGREVTRLVDGNVSAGWHQVRWDASQLASGTYIYRIQVAGQVQSRIMTLIK
ncbi:MAG: T9SS type A sorting domain-containing protein [Bacteroidetes bacterium]|nr:T9SS type A sorting domain-containing protein [Bacteroidota bacterium]MCH8523997.1 T9SS type A sorting domain-containing protein [Balneolales bacterium]